MRAHATVRSWSMLVLAVVALTGCGSAQPTPPPTPAASPSSEPSAALLLTAAPTLAASPSARSSASTVPSEMPSSAAEASPLVGPTPTPEPTPRPTLKPPLVEISLINPGGNITVAPITSGDHITSTLNLAARHVDRSTCVLKHRITPDKPGIEPSTVVLEPRATQTVKLIDGHHYFTVRCPVSKQLVPSGEVTSFRDMWVFDGQPERCAKFTFEESDITAATFDELTAGVVGKWSGCVSTPWTPLYHVDVELRADGTYSAKSGEELDGRPMTALYYGIDDDSPFKTYAINDMQASKKGVGQIDLVFDAGQPGVRGDMRDIRLMGDKLEFEVFNREYGPVTLRLTREGAAG